MSSLPTGTVTYLFTDVEGSVKLWEQDPPAMREAMRRHDELVKQSSREYRGRIVRPRGEGDSRFIVFARATDAVAAACVLQRALGVEPWATSTPIRVRMALHTGEEELRAGDYYGPAVNRCARVRGIAHGGQTLLTLATVEQVHDGLPEGASLRPLGEHRLKDLQRPEQVFQLLHPDLPDKFPPLRSVDVWPNNLPIQLTSFIGREKEIAEVKQVLTSARLVTLTGAGGCGKTRLALQVAAEVQEGYPDGVWLVELGGLADSALVPQTAATALTVREEPHRTLTESLVEHLRPKQVLLVMDNCEHVVEACAQTVGTLLGACPKLQVLVTSREVLGITGEVAWRVPSLRLPDSHRLPPTRALTEYEAVRLFSERAETAAPGFRVTTENATIVVQICYRLDGIPLAIELAAARIKVLSEAQVGQRLNDRFRLLTGGSRTALPRHQTLRATMDWSYDLLTDQERVLLRRLGAFAGGFTLESAEAVGAGDGVRDCDILDLLVHLVDKSLVLVDDQRQQKRYRLLETVRQYAWDKLVEAQETEDVRERHRSFFLQFAERIEPELSVADQTPWLDLLEVEHGNLTAALDWSLERAPNAGLQLAAAVWRFWEMRGHLSEGRRWFERFLALTEDKSVSAALRAKALNGAGVLARDQGDYRQARMFHDEALTLRRELGDKQAIAMSLNNLGVVAKDQGDYGRAAALHEAALALRRELGDRRGIASSLNNLGVIAEEHGEHERAWKWYEESLALLRQLRDNHGVAVVLNNMANVAFAQSDYPRAVSLHHQSLTLSREQGNRRGVALSLTNLSALALRQGRLDDATRCSGEALTLQRDLGDMEGMASCLEGFADVACARGQFERAGRLFAAAEVLRETIGAPLPPIDRQDHDRRVAATRAGLSEVACTVAWAAGRTMNLDEAIAYALSEEDPVATIPEGAHTEEEEGNSC